ncbi:MAG TPA: sigma 54-interacting transcriptional regulator [Polyangiales bacterium]|nr:sigma 54-interacting transcriptional regulator [Polyangiales bacterium]
MLNSSQSKGDGEQSKPAGELRAFVATMFGGRSWVVDLLPNYELVIGSDHEADIRVDVPDVVPRHATLCWNGEQIELREFGAEDGVHLNGDRINGAIQVKPGDEIDIGPATLVVNITVAPVSKGRRSLTHQEFAERLNEELSRAARGGRTTCLVMLKSKSGDGSRLADAALSTFRAGDIVGTYAHDEIEFLLPDTPPKVTKAVVERLLETAAAEGAHVGLAVAPGDGDDADVLVRAARDALANSIRTGVTISRTGVAEPNPTEPSAHTETTRALLATLNDAAQRDEPVLLIGEPNTGKRTYARLIHEKGPRAAGPYVVIQCAGLVDQESITKAFGDDNGNVSKSQAETASGGTLVLDDIGDLPLPGQRRLLRLFAQGSENYGIVSTTHRDLTALSQVGAFMRELFDKISARRIQVPALRMRQESIVPLAQNFAEQFKPDKPIKLSAGAIEKMRSYAWPGNVLELRNAMERALALADGGEILAEHLPGDLTDTGEGRLRDHVGSVERDAIIKALADNNYNQTHAARLLGISRRALIYKMEKYGLKPPPAGSSAATPTVKE